MAEIVAQGRVVECRNGMLVVQNQLGTGETTHEVRHDCLPGQYVLVYDDGQVEVFNERHQAHAWLNRPSETRVEVPKEVPDAGQDHS